MLLPSLIKFAENGLNLWWGPGTLKPGTSIAEWDIEFYPTDELSRDEDIVVYCHHGVRSAAVAGYLRQLGFNAVNLAGGLDAWAQSVDPSMRRY
jgi:rhodanese-related sulfurtransferase